MEIVPSSYAATGMLNIRKYCKKPEAGELAREQVKADVHYNLYKTTQGTIDHLEPW